MADVRVPIQTKYDGQGFAQLQKDAARLRKLQERHNRAVLTETRQQIAAQKRLQALNRKLERQLASDARKRGQQTVAVNQLIAVGAAAIAVEGRRAIELAKEQAAAEAQLAAAIRSTGGAAGLSARELKDLAGQMQSLTNFGDEAVIKSEALLLTFTNIGGETFPRATKAILDVSTAMDQGLKETSIQVGKALNAPVEGLSALRRVGIQFTESQEQQIKTMVEAGRVADAQAVILGELERQFGGSAEAAREADAGFQAAANAVGDLEEAIGRTLLPTTREYNELVIEAAQGWTTAIDSLNLLAKAHDELAESERGGLLGLRDTIASYDDWFEKINPVYGLTQQLIEAGLDLAFDQENLAGAVQKVVAEEEAAADAINAYTAATEAATEATEDNTAALEQQARRLERVNSIRQDFARDLLRIDEQAAEDVEQVWSDYWTDQEDEWQDHNKRLNDLRKRAAKEAEKSDRDLAKALSKIDQDTEKRIAKVKADAAKEQRNETKRRQVDVLADERLFNFDLQQLAAEGQGNAIREAIERRAIEEEIAKEKAAVESQIEAEKQADEIAGIRETANERRAQLQQDHAEEKQLREERLAEEEAAEEDSYAERMIALRDYRTEKLAEIEAGRIEAVAELGEELAEMDDLTRSELQALTPVAGELGEQAGKAFAEGLSKGFETNQTIDEMLGATPGAPSSLTPGMPHPGLYPRFQFGGTVPGPIGQPTLAVVHGGETVSPPGQAAHSFNVTINASGGVDQARVETLFQQFTDEILVPALS